MKILFKFTGFKNNKREGKKKKTTVCKKMVLTVYSKMNKITYICIIKVQIFDTLSMSRAIDFYKWGQNVSEILIFFKQTNNKCS